MDPKRGRLVICCSCMFYSSKLFILENCNATMKFFLLQLLAYTFENDIKIFSDSEDYGVKNFMTVLARIVVDWVFFQV